MVPGGVTVNKYVGDFIKQEVDNFLHKNADIAEVIQQKIQESEKERKAIAGVTKLARERAKKANLHNRKLRDCRIHLKDWRKTPASLSPRETLQAVPSPKVVMSTPKLYSVSVVNH